MRHFLDLESTGADALRLILDEAKRRLESIDGPPSSLPSNTAHAA